MGWYFVYGLAGTITFFERLRPITLWRWYLGDNPLSHGWNAGTCLALAAVSLLAVAFGTWAFGRRDLHS